MTSREKSRTCDIVGARKKRRLREIRERPGIRITRKTLLRSVILTFCNYNQKRRDIARDDANQLQV